MFLSAHGKETRFIINRVQPNTVCFVPSFCFYPKMLIDCIKSWYRVATWSGKNKKFLKSGKSQGKVRENLSSCQSQWKVRDFFAIQGEKSGNFLEFREFTGFWTQGIWNALRSKSREKHKEIEHEDKNIDGLQKKLKLK